MQQSWLNGVPTDQISLADRGLSYGDGVFETIRVSAGRAEYLNEHLQRMQLGASRLAFPDNAVPQIAADLQRIDLSGDLNLKLTLTRGEGPRGYALPEQPAVSRIIALSPGASSLSAQWQNGVRVRHCDYQLAINPALAGIKHLNRLEQVVARSEWSDKAIAEGLLCDREGFLAEGTMSNLFWVDRAGMVFTPLLDRCGVRGVMRDHLLKLIDQLGYSWREGRYPKSALNSASEIFLCNSLIRIWPVRQLEDQRFQVGPVTRQLQQLLQQETP